MVIDMGAMVILFASMGCFTLGVMLGHRLGTLEERRFQSTLEKKDEE